MSNWVKPPLGAQINYGHPLANGLIGYLLMNEGGGSIVQDLSGNAKHGTFVADTHFVGGRLGPAVDLDGTGDYIDCGVMDSAEKSLVFRLKLDVVGDFDDRIITTSEANEGYFFWYDVGNLQWAMRWRAGAVERIDYFGDTPVADRWYQIVTTYRSGYRQNFVDGQLISTGTNLTGALDTFGQNLRIGGGFFWTPNTNGQIDHLIVYDRALDIGEAKQLYREPFCILEREPIELWVGSVGAGVPPAGNAAIMTPNTGFWGPTF